jgi:hypothetical protein
MSYTAEAHAQWHTVHGWDSCPLDCYAVEAYWEEQAEKAEYEERYEALPPEEKAKWDAELKAHVEASAKERAERAERSASQTKDYPW